VGETSFAQHVNSGALSGSFHSAAKVEATMHANHEATARKDMRRTILFMGWFAPTATLNGLMNMLMVIFEKSFGLHRIGLIEGAADDLGSAFHRAIDLIS